MSNRLKVAKVLSIKQLHDQGWSQRRIARELGISRDAVARCLAKASDSSQLNPEEGKSNKATCEEAPTGSPPTIRVSNQATIMPQAPTGSDDQPAPDSSDQIADAPSESRSQCRPFRQLIIDKLEQGLSAQRIFQDLVDEHGFDAEYPSVRRFVARLNQAQPLPYRRIEVSAGEEAQIDFGTGAPVIDDEGKRRRTHVLRVVLSHSRKGYSEAVFRQTTENFIRCIENAFRHFGGVPKTLVPDNVPRNIIGLMCLLPLCGHPLRWLWI